MRGTPRGSRVEHRIRKMFDDAGVRGWLHVAELRHPSSHVAVDSEEPVPMGSVYKLPLMVAFWRLVETGAIDPAAQMTLHPADRVAGPTGISVLSDPVTLSLRDMVVLMMSISDNTAAHAVLRAVGPGVVDEMCADLGMPDTHIHGGVVSTFARLVAETGSESLSAAMARISDNDDIAPSGVYDPVTQASTTPEDMARLLRAIWTDRAASGEHCSVMREIMSRQPWTHRLASGFPYDDVAVYGKTGTFGAMRHEAGVVEFPDGSAYTAVVFTQAARADTRLPRADAVIGEVAREAVEELHGNQGVRGDPHDTGA
ncbi:class A beta-lactamase-related serine hydrolase [Streptomyces sp. BE147]|nr:class A beta-lactamase-related serine hydrolase [Streptomyces sp. BE147]